MAHALHEQGVGQRILGALEVSGLALDANEVAIFTPEAGWVNADTALSELFRLAMRCGVEFELQEIETLDTLESGFQSVVLACGAWVGRFAPIDVGVRVQTVAYVEHLFDGPVWIEDGPNFLYGFPTAPGETTVKIGVHAHGQNWNLVGPRPGPDPLSIELIREFARTRFGIDEPRIAETVTCLYTVTPDEMFRWGRCGEKSFYVSACSGHGFKFGPWIGCQMADMIEGLSSPESIPQFCRR